jgi:hypothetical protein
MRTRTSVPGNLRVAAILGAVVVAACQAAPGSTAGPATPPAVSSPSSPPTATANPSPDGSPLPAPTETYTSAVHGLSVGHPAGWVVRPATEPWTEGIPFQASLFGDVIHDRADENLFLGLASQLLGDRTGEAWADAITADDGWADSCAPSAESITVDGNPGRLVVHCPSGMPTALAWTGDRGYLVVLYPATDMTWFRTVLDTLRLDPERAVDAP